MAGLDEALQAIQPWLFITLMVAAVVQWRRHRDRPSGWLAATFVSLGLVVVAGQLLTEDQDSGLEQKILIAVLALFPYCLYRFSTTLVPARRWVEVVANGLTLATIGSVFLLERIPQDDEPRSAAFTVFVWLLLTQWVFLSARVAYRLWDAGKGQPTVARRRMRTLSLGATGMALALVLAGSADPGGEATIVNIATDVLALISAPLFLLGFAPPAVVRSLWRRREDEELARAERRLIAATTSAEVAQTLLDPVTRLVGGQGAALFDADGAVVGYHGLEHYRAEEISTAIRTNPDELPVNMIVVPMQSGWLAVQGSRFTPFFGREEVDLVQRLADRADVALDRLRGQQAVREQAELIDLASDAIFVREIDGTVRYWSAGAQRMYGWTAEEALGRPIQDLLATELPLPFDEILGILEQEARWEGEIVHRRKDGSTLTVDSRWAIQRAADGAPTRRILELNTDITERKRQEELRDRFIANAAHELRTPLTSLLGFIDLLGDDWERTPEADRKMLFDGIRRAGDRLLGLVNSLLDLTRLQARETGLPVRPTAIGAVCKDVASHVPIPDGVSLEVDCDGDAVAFADAQRLEQIVSNLLTNAFRYGGSTVSLATERHDGTVRIRVTDNGPGVDEKLKNTLFEPFSRGTKSSSVGGSGLGLAIVKTLAVSMGGDVRYEPVKPTGASFTVTLRGATAT